MNAANLIDRLERFPAGLQAIISGLSAAELTWRPETGEWSALEILCHLRDEEQEDFPVRLRLTLEEPDSAWPPIDPAGAAIRRNYQGQDVEVALATFVQARAQSIHWIRSVASPDWSRTHVHPKFGPISAGDLLTSWAAHDALHLRQLAKRQFQMTQTDGTGYSTSYAGEWRA